MNPPVWYILKPGLIRDKKRGPYTDTELFAQLATLKKGTLVSDGDEWTKLQDHAVLAKALEKKRAEQDLAICSLSEGVLVISLIASACAIVGGLVSYAAFGIAMLSGLPGGGKTPDLRLVNFIASGGIILSPIIATMGWTTLVVAFLVERRKPSIEWGRFVAPTVLALIAVPLSLWAWWWFVGWWVVPIFGTTLVTTVIVGLYAVRRSLAEKRVWFVIALLVVLTASPLLWAFAISRAKDNEIPQTPPLEVLASMPGEAASKRLITSEQLALGGSKTNSIGMVLVLMPAGEFTMGDLEDELAESKPHPESPNEVDSGVAFALRKVADVKPCAIRV